MTTFRRRWLYAAALIPIVLLAWFYWDPRPYYVTEMDIEQDYYYAAQVLYYAAQVLLDTEELRSVHHPGVPVYALGSALLATVGNDPATAQSFLAQRTGLSLCSMRC